MPSVCRRFWHRCHVVLGDRVLDKTTLPDDLPIAVKPVVGKRPARRKINKINFVGLVLSALVVGDLGRGDLATAAPPSPLPVRSGEPQPIAPQTHYTISGCPDSRRPSAGSAIASRGNTGLVVGWRRTIAQPGDRQPTPPARLEPVYGWQASSNLGSPSASPPQTSRSAPGSAKTCPGRLAEGGQPAGWRRSAQWAGGWLWWMRGLELPSAGLGDRETWPGWPGSVAMEDSEWVANVQVQALAGGVSFSHHVWHTCCADLAVESTVETTGGGRLIRAIERDRGVTCRCMCDFQVAASVSNLPPGNYKLEVYGEFAGSKAAPVLLFGRSIEVPGK